MLSPRRWRDRLRLSRGAGALRGGEEREAGVRRRRRCGGDGGAAPGGGAIAARRPRAAARGRRLDVGALHHRLAEARVGAWAPCNSSNCELKLSVQGLVFGLK